jgi:nucleoside-diphosphate-sugar epimerase
MNGCRILVTGGTGFIGKYLLHELKEKDCQIYVLDTRTSEIGRLKGLEVKLLHGDIRSYRSLHPAIKWDVDVIIHLAALVRRLGTTIKSKDFYDVNVNGTNNVCRFAVEANVKRMIHISSTDVHGSLPRGVIPIDETYRFNPSDDYEYSKVMSEKIVLNYYRDYGLNVVILRPTWVYGEGAKGCVDIIERYVKSLPIIPILGNGATLKHFVHVKDVVQGIIKAIDRGKPGKAYFLADSNPVKIIDLFRMICKTWTLKRKFVNIPVSYGVAKYLENMLPVSFRHIITWFYENQGYDIKNSMSELGFVPKISLQEGLKRLKLYEEGVFYEQLHS